MDTPINLLDALWYCSGFGCQCVSTYPGTRLYSLIADIEKPAGDISLPELPEETNQELDQAPERIRKIMEVLRPPDERQTRPDKEPPLRQTSPEAAEEKPTRPIGQGRPEVNRKSQTAFKGFHMGQIVKRVILIIVGALIFTVIGQFIYILIGISGTDAATFINLVLFIVGAIVGNMLYDRGVG